MKYIDGADLGEGLVVSAKGGFLVAAYRCRICEREQMAQHQQFIGGIDERTAEQAGWEKYGDKWMCPFCSENEQKLKAAFDSEAATLQ